MWVSFNLCCTVYFVHSFIFKIFHLSWSDMKILMVGWACCLTCGTSVLFLFCFVFLLCFAMSSRLKVLLVVVEVYIIAYIMRNTNKILYRKKNILSKGPCILLLFCHWIIEHLENSWTRDPGWNEVIEGFLLRSYCLILSSMVKPQNLLPFFVSALRRLGFCSILGKFCKTVIESFSSDSS